MSNYAKADTKTQWYEDNYPGATMNLTAMNMVLVLHTTEGYGWPVYSGGSMAPNYTGQPPVGKIKGDWRGHFPDEKSSRALENHAGGVETNTQNAVQVELIGTCDPKHAVSWDGKGKILAGVHYVYWPKANDLQLAWLADFIADQHKRHGLSLTAPAKFNPYPASYGATADRLTYAEWNSSVGILGHEHVPENSHGDPGYIDIAKIIKFAKGSVPVTTASSVLIQNCASKRSDVGAGSWSKRKSILIKEILAEDASFVVCPELYSGQRDDISKGIAKVYALAGYREGRVMYYHKARWTPTTKSYWKDMIAKAKGKPAIGRTFKNTKGVLLTLIGMHTSYETTASGSADRKKEINAVIVWAKKTFVKNAGRRIYAGDVNAPANSTTRPDDVGPIFKAHGYHDLGMEVRPTYGKGHYHLDRGFGGDGVTGTQVHVHAHAGSDHPATRVTFTF